MPKMHKAILHVVGKYDEHFYCVIPQWSLRHAVGFKIASVPEKYRNKIKTDFVFIADVNISEDDINKIEFKGFKVAPKPDPNDGLA